MSETKKKYSQATLHYKILLAKEVEKYVVIWDIRAKKDKQALEDAWRKVKLALHEKNVDKCKQEWQLLQETYRQHIFQSIRWKSTALIEALAFLKPQMLAILNQKAILRKESNIIKKQGNPSTTDRENKGVSLAIVHHLFNTMRPEHSPMVKLYLLHLMQKMIPRLRPDIIKHAREQMSEHNKTIYTIDWSALSIPQNICEAVFSEYQRDLTVKEK